MRYHRVKPKHRSGHGSALSAYNRVARYERLEASARAPVGSSALRRAQGDYEGRRGGSSVFYRPTLTVEP